MKPVLILQHLSSDGPAYLGTWLARQGLPFVVRNTQAGEAYPESMREYSALAVLGGEMSANDALPSLRQAEALILDAMARERPVIGHCLGGQLMARALGARVKPAPLPEIGWQAITVAAHASATDWFGEPGVRQVFQWHEEAFELPPGAVALASSAGCEHQAFALGMHLGMQFHVEVDEDKLRRWARLDTPQYRELQQRFATVQSGPAMCDALASKLPAHQALADRIYARWCGSALDTSG
jgi:GMP synthase-like glutamine amidotransferase